jgi:Mn2+/Fe2+ NRAMP family transporter
VIGASALLGVAIVFANISPIKALFWASIINGVLSPFLLVGVLLISCDRNLMQHQPSSWLSRVLVGVTAVIMFVAASAMFVL